jgi:chemotaxis protein CheX
MSTAKKTIETLQQVRKEMPKEVTSKYLLQIYESVKDSVEPTELSFDFHLTAKIEHTSYPQLHRIKNHITKNGGSFYSIKLSAQLLNQIQTDGVLGLFNAKNTADSKPTTKRKLDVDFLNPFIDATVHTLNVQAFLKVTCGAPALKTNTDPNVDIIGVISLISNVFEGSISICFPKNTFIAICNKLFGENHTEINSEIEDAAGELLNMIFGSAKGQLNNKYNYQIQKALPTVVSGQKLKLKQSKGPTITLPFQSEAGPFQLEIELVEK